MYDPSATRPLGTTVRNQGPYRWGVPNRRPTSDLSVLFDLFAAGQRLKRLLAVAMEGSPLRPEEYAAYSVVFDRGPLTPTEMAGLLGMPVTTALDHVRLMSRRGHVTRRRHPEDGRSYLVSLTESGRRTHSEAGRAFDRAMLPLAQNLGIDPVDVRRVLEALGEAMDTTFEGLLEGQAEAG